MPDYGNRTLLIRTVEVADADRIRMAAALCGKSMNAWACGVLAEASSYVLQLRLIQQQETGNELLAAIADLNNRSFPGLVEAMGFHGAPPVS